MEPVLIASYHQAVIDALRSLPWVGCADEYPETATQLTTPAVYIDIPGWERDEDSDGQPRVNLNVDLYLVIDRAGDSSDVPKPQIYARCLAMDLSNWVDGAMFGLDNVEPAIVTDCGVDTFDRLFDDYIVFRVSYEQTIPSGEEIFPTPGGAPLRAAWISREPDVGQAHIDDYRQIYREGAPVDG